MSIFFSKILLLDVESNNAEILALNPLLTEKTNIFVPNNFSPSPLPKLFQGGSQITFHQPHDKNWHTNQKVQLIQASFRKHGALVVDDSRETDVILTIRRYFSAKIGDIQGLRLTPLHNR